MQALAAPASLNSGGQTNTDTHYDPHQSPSDQISPVHKEECVFHVLYLVQSCQESVRAPFVKLLLKSYL